MNAHRVFTAKQKTRNMCKLKDGVSSERGGRRGLSGEASEWDVRAKSESPVISFPSRRLDISVKLRCILEYLRCGLDYPLVRCVGVGKWHSIFK